MTQVHQAPANPVNNETRVGSSSQTIGTAWTRELELHAEKHHEACKRWSVGGGSAVEIVYAWKLWPDAIGKLDLSCTANKSSMLLRLNLTSPWNGCKSGFRQWAEYYGKAEEVKVAQQRVTAMDEPNAQRRSFWNETARVFYRSGVFCSIVPGCVVNIKRLPSKNCFRYGPPSYQRRTWTEMRWSM